MDNSRKIRCPKCKQTYIFLGAFKDVSFCPECLLAEEELFQQIKDYVVKNPGSSLSDLFLEFDVPSQKIKKYLIADKPEHSSNNNNFLRCEKCGIVVNNGSYCAKCEELNSSDQDTIKAASKLAVENGQPSHKNIVFKGIKKY